MLNLSFQLSTVPKPDADNIVGGIISETKINLNETNSVTWISWNPPDNPNNLIMSYNIRYHSTKIQYNNPPINKSAFVGVQKLTMKNTGKIYCNFHF